MFNFRLVFLFYLRVFSDFFPPEPVCCLIVIVSLLLIGYQDFSNALAQIE